MDLYSVYKIFTPSSINVNSFLERTTDETREFVETLKIPGKYIILYGPIGAGKKTFAANKISQCCEEDISSYCKPEWNFQDLLTDGFDLLDAFYTSSKGSKKNKSH